MFFSDFYVFIKQHALLVVIWSVLLIIVCYSLVMNWMRGRFEISCNKLILLINKRNAVVIDIRSHNDYNSGYIINSINIPLENIENNDSVSYKSFKNNPLIIVDNYATSLLSVKQYFNKLGIMEVYILKGGINNWKNNSFPLLLNK